MIVVADTSPLFHLARIGRLELVPAVAGSVMVPRTVWNRLGDELVAEFLRAVGETP